MKLSTRGRYGLKAMVDLAVNFGEGPISLNSIATRQGISLSYLEQLISPLRKSGLVKSIRGAQGGYLLNKEPKEISVGDVLIVLEGSLAPVDCLDNSEEESCGSSQFCVSKIIYEKIHVAINEVVNKTSLADMAKEYKELDKSNEVDIVCKCIK